MWDMVSFFYKQKSFKLKNKLIDWLVEEEEEEKN